MAGGNDTKPPVGNKFPGGARFAVVVVLVINHDDDDEHPEACRSLICPSYRGYRPVRKASPPNQASREL